MDKNLLSEIQSNDKNTENENNYKCIYKHIHDYNLNYNLDNFEIKQDLKPYYNELNNNNTNRQFSNHSLSTNILFNNSNDYIKDKYNLFSSYSITYKPFTEKENKNRLINSIDDQLTIPTCWNCRAFINVYCFFDQNKNGKKWVCNICKHVNLTPDHYYCPIDPITNLRFDIKIKPELFENSYEFTSKVM